MRVISRFFSQLRMAALTHNPNKALLVFPVITFGLGVWQVAIEMISFVQTQTHTLSLSLSLSVLAVTPTQVERGPYCDHEQGTRDGPGGAADGSRAGRRNGVPSRQSGRRLRARAGAPSGPALARHAVRHLQETRPASLAGRRLSHCHPTCAIGWRVGQSEGASWIALALGVLTAIS